MSVRPGSSIVLFNWYVLREGQSCLMDNSDSLSGDYDNVTVSTCLHTFFLEKMITQLDEQ